MELFVQFGQYKRLLNYKINITFATILIFGKNASLFEIALRNVRQHTVECLLVINRYF